MILTKSNFILIILHEKMKETVYQRILIMFLLFVTEACGKALAMRLVNKLREEELYRKVSDRANNVYWTHRSGGLSIDNCEYGDMMWEIDYKYMREVDKAGAQRAEHQIQALWEELMGMYLPGK
eukprot:gnl/MRDRNA2_/MRDRNA2_158212_c0_seq1.p1 gnl/MRDRNA2_/MRDRNA2_158212_c0~~gnl/MRDRNA2_/MRDRNA2_158212_c0_seq1.p1  ORF type:complete len:124 (-),score=18.13 gnl/MRDRNA2_/MRDRNA2_158212_c0_seq1:127-498(-)